MSTEVTTPAKRARVPRLFSGLLSLIILVVGGYQSIEWTLNRVYVPEGYSLQLRYKGPPLPFLPGSKPTALPGTFADVDEKGNPKQLGVLKEMLGPGRHFFWFGWWETKLIKDTVVNPGEVAVVTSKMGDDLPGGTFLVDGTLDQTKEKGILRQVLGPGTYRNNDYAYAVDVIRELSPIS